MQGDFLRGYAAWLRDNGRVMPNGELADNLGNRLEYGESDFPQRDKPND